MASFSVEEWREGVRKKIKESGGWLKGRWQRDVPHVVYGTLAGLALLPLVEAMAQAGSGGNALLLTIGTASFKLLGDVGVNLTASLLEQWKDKAASLDALADEAGRLAEQDPQLRQALDQLVAKLEVIPQVQSQLSREQQQWFVATLGRETAALGSSLTQVVAGLAEIKQDTAHLPAMAANLERLANPADPLEKAIRDYLVRLEPDCNQLTDLAALSLDTEETAGLTLDKVYIDLDTTTPTRKKDGQAGPPLPAGAAVFQDRRMVLLGEPAVAKAFLSATWRPAWPKIGGALAAPCLG